MQLTAYSLQRTAYSLQNNLKLKAGRTTPFKLTYNNIPTPKVALVDENRALHILSRLTKIIVTVLPTISKSTDNHKEQGMKAIELTHYVLAFSAVDIAVSSGENFI